MPEQPGPTLDLNRFQYEVAEEINLDLQKLRKKHSPGSKTPQQPAPPQPRQ